MSRLEPMIVVSNATRSRTRSGYKKAEATIACRLHRNQGDNKLLRRSADPRQLTAAEEVGREHRGQ